jgi:predicted HicB family RNase H-like nuclease
MTCSVLTLRLPHSLKATAEVMARQDGVSLNQFIAQAVAEKLQRLQVCEGRARAGSIFT